MPHVWYMNHSESNKISGQTNHIAIPVRFRDFLAMFTAWDSGAAPLGAGCSVSTRKKLQHVGQTGPLFANESAAWRWVDVSAPTFEMLPLKTDVSLWYHWVNKPWFLLQTVSLDVAPENCHPVLATYFISAWLLLGWFWKKGGNVSIGFNKNGWCIPYDSDTINSGV